MKTKIYQFKVYDIGIDDYRLSRRYATLGAIEKIRSAEVIDGSEVEIETNQLNGNGMTEIGFNPNPRTESQSTVTS